MVSSRNNWPIVAKTSFAGRPGAQTLWTAERRQYQVGVNRGLLRTHGSTSWRSRLLGPASPCLSWRGQPLWRHVLVQQCCPAVIGPWRLGTGQPRDRASRGHVDAGSPASADARLLLPGRTGKLPGAPTLDRDPAFEFAPHRRQAASARRRHVRNGDAFLICRPRTSGDTVDRASQRAAAAVLTLWSNSLSRAQYGFGWRSTSVSRVGALA